MASILSCVLGAFTLIIGVWGVFDSPVLVLFDATEGIVAVWIILGAVTLALALWALPLLPLWMRITGIVLLMGAVAGFAFDDPFGRLFPDTTPNNLLMLALALGFCWSGFVSKPPITFKLEPPPMNDEE
jgi:hypothetical protein